MKDKASPTKPTNTIWTPANIVTLVRILLVPVFFVAIISPWPDWFPEWDEAEAVKPWLAALLFAVLACTDALDGYLARSRGEVTNFGKFMDPLADKILVAAALLALCELQVLPAWVALVILTREFIVSGLRMLAASEGVVVAASWYGKAKTVFQIIAILLFIVKDSQPFIQDPSIEGPLYVISWIFMAIALALTVVSLVDYLAKCRNILRFTPSDTQKGTPEVISYRADGPGNEGSKRSSEAAQLAKQVIVLAEQKRAKLSTAESCTGGLIAGALTAIPGSSAVIEGGIVSYSNQVKHAVLGVPTDALERHGAVSEPVAKAMAEGSRKHLSTTIAVAVTGIAGPGGGSAEKPVGTVWFGIDGPSGASAEMLHFDGDRDEIRQQTVVHALEMFKAALENI
ncbi:CDP-diacylglycerol--glycerol-3-phosphate 3-phosphatidyltransferase [Anaerotardibacter muris]|uniref:CDP-diacylglycerol--glycerol-3-phosphate 3-phosphatidyltransferase n=1 Tax=Anaerotardibacter muris TaxID=2941505 RepID=UPI00203BC746|nr:CDP-diacylglycerol--glycerol-3-phosphate 3-phosphatidyltransferase [Anaerotardibacter muris]